MWAERPSRGDGPDFVDGLRPPNTPARISPSAEPSCPGFKIEIGRQWLEWPQFSGQAWKVKCVRDRTNSAYGGVPAKRLSIVNEYLRIDVAACRTNGLGQHRHTADKRRSPGGVKQCPLKIGDTGDATHNRANIDHGF